MRLRIQDDGQPIFRQIVDQIRSRIVSGSLAPGAELPAIRVLATSLAVNPNTIARAYRELESDGWVEKRRTRGTFVRDDVGGTSMKRRREQLDRPIDDLLDIAGDLDVDIATLCDWVRRRHAAGSGASKSSKPESRKR